MKTGRRRLHAATIHLAAKPYADKFRDMLQGSNHGSSDLDREGPIREIAQRFHALCLKDTGILYEDPYVQEIPSGGAGGNNQVSKLFRLTLFRFEA
ncbi:hypothetical protein L2E82_51367 [Cichorium intybus]|nr:hypothetical protein L2E82_51367 [Cichorium intybus]